jgi:hypothetical protein
MALFTMPDSAYFLAEGFIALSRMLLRGREPPRGSGGQPILSPESA